AHVARERRHRLVDGPLPLPEARPERAEHPVHPAQLPPLGQVVVERVARGPRPHVIVRVEDLVHHIDLRLARQRADHRVRPRARPPRAPAAPPTAPPSQQRRPRPAESPPRRPPPPTNNNPPPPPGHPPRPPPPRPPPPAPPPAPARGRAPPPPRARMPLLER